MLLVIFAPALASCIVLLLHCNAAARLTLNGVPIEQTMRNTLLTVQFGQTPLSSAKVMFSHFQQFWKNAILAGLYFCIPSLMMLFKAYRSNLFCATRVSLIAS
jgi:hypothetical protein